MTSTFHRRYKDILIDLVSGFVIVRFSSSILVEIRTCLIDSKSFAAV